MLKDCDLLPAAMVPGTVAFRRPLTFGMSSEIRPVSVYRFASSITMRVMAIPLDGPRYRGVSSVSLSLTRPPGRMKSSWSSVRGS